MKKSLLFSLFLLMMFTSLRAQNVSKNCYRGYVDVGYGIGVGDYTFGRFQLNTSHGYQVNPFFFIGAGIGLHMTPSYEDIIEYRDSQVDIPIFANVRINTMKGYIVPFVDGRLGTYINNNGDLYYNVSAGCRVALNTKQAIYLSLGYENGKLEFNRQSRNRTTIRMVEAFTIRIGFEF